jgi:hypothetical protein
VSFEVRDLAAFDLAAPDFRDSNQSKRGLAFEVHLLTALRATNELTELAFSQKDEGAGTPSDPEHVVSHFQGDKLK